MLGSPYGEIIEVPSQRSKRLNVLGFLTPDNDLESFCFEGTVDPDVVVACFDNKQLEKLLNHEL